MSLTRLTLWGMYKYNPNILDFVGILPQGMNAETLEDAILGKCGELYPYHQVPSILKDRIRFWAVRRSPQWGRMWVALTEEYNPLHNYDRTEIHDESGKSSGKDSDSSKGTTSGKASNSGKVEDKRSAYDTSTYQPESLSESSASTSDSSSSTASRSGTKSDEFQNKLNIRAYGNIGVTTSATMLGEELEIRRADLYNMIAEEFEREFCSQCYS